MKNQRKFEDVLGEVARQGLVRADAGLLLAVADRLWYAQEVPDLGQVPAHLRNDAGYLVDCLARFNVLKKEQKLRVINAVNHFKPAVHVGSKCKDPLAVAWQASADLTSRLPELMPYQTRQYALDRSQAAVTHAY